MAPTKRAGSDVFTHVRPHLMGSTARTVAMMSSVLCLRPDTFIRPSLEPQTKTRPPGPRKPSRPVRTNSASPATYFPSSVSGLTCRTKQLLLLTEFTGPDNTTWYLYFSRLNVKSYVISCGRNAKRLHLPSDADQFFLNINPVCNKHTCRQNVNDTVLTILNCIQVPTVSTWVVGTGIGINQIVNHCRYSTNQMLKHCRYLTVPYPVLWIRIRSQQDPDPDKK